MASGIVNLRRMWLRRRRVRCGAAMCLEALLCTTIRQNAAPWQAATWTTSRDENGGGNRSGVLSTAQTGISMLAPHREGGVDISTYYLSSPSAASYHASILS